jgi:hypothetical protein
VGVGSDVETVMVARLHRPDVVGETPRAYGPAAALWECPADQSSCHIDVPARGDDESPRVHAVTVISVRCRVYGAVCCTHVARLVRGIVLSRSGQTWPSASIAPGSR